MNSFQLKQRTHRNFAHYLLSRLFATIAIQMQSIAIAWQLYELTGDVVDLGLIGLFHFVPFLLLILIGGQATDRYHRHTIILSSLFAQLLCATFLLYITVAQWTMKWPLFAAAAMLGSVRAFLMPATQAILTSLVSPAGVKKAIALGSFSFQFSMIAGPALAGLAYLSGPSVVFGGVVGLLLLSILLMALVHLQPQTHGKRPTSWINVFEGLQFVRSKPIIWGALSLDLFTVFFGGVTALLPAYVHEVLQSGPNELGLLRTAPGIGAMVSAIALTFRPVTRRVGLWMFCGVVVFGMGTVMLGVSHSLPFAFIALVLIGSSDMISVYIRQILIQCGTPDAIRGRVSAINAVFIGTSNELGEFESGLTASWFGLTRAMILAGVTSIVGSAFWAWRFPALSRLDHFPQSTLQQDIAARQPQSPDSTMTMTTSIK